MKTFPLSPWKKQRGVMTLFVTVMALVLITIMTVYSSQVGVMDQRMSGNENRYKMAFDDAQANLDRVIDQWSTQATTADCIYPTPCTITGLTTSSVMKVIAKTKVDDGVDASCALVPGSGAVMPTSAYVGIACAQGTSDDGTGHATVSRELTLRALNPGSPGSPAAPIIASGAVTSSGGNLNVGANPNGAGPGVPVSIWSHQSINTGGSVDTCNLGDYGTSGNGGNATTQCQTYLSGGPQQTQGPDVIPNDPLTTDSPPGNFPPDIFDYAFGVPATSWRLIYDTSTLIDQASKCALLNRPNVGVYWVTTKCQFSGNNSLQIGAAIDDPTTTTVREGPVIVVMDEDSELKCNGGVTIYGLVFAFDNPDKTGTPGAIDCTGGATIQGLLMANTSLDGLLKGTLSVLYNSDVINSFAGNSTSPPPNQVPTAYIAGSWRDFH